jgi:hypothetical protein
MKKNVSYLSFDHSKNYETSSILNFENQMPIDDFPKLYDIISNAPVKKRGYSLKIYRDKCGCYHLIQRKK